MITPTKPLSSKTKSSYHPYLLLAFHLNILPDHLLQQIPRSTRYEWQHKDISVLFGHDWYLQNQETFNTLQQVFNNKKLLQVNKSLLRIIALNRFIKQYHTRIKENIGNIKKVLLSNFNKVSSVLSIKTMLKCLQLTWSSYLQIKKKQHCVLSPLDICYVKHPAQLLNKEIEVIKSYCLDVKFLYWPLSSIYHQVVRDRAAAFHISTFYKYVSLLKLQRTKLSHKRKNHHIGIRASFPLQIIHADATILKTTDNNRNYIYLVQDNFSRAILTHRVAQDCKAQYVFENLLTVKQQYLAPAHIDTCQLITDDRSENHGMVSILPAGPPFIEHLIAQKDIEFSNSMIEAANKQLKYHFLYHQHIPDFEALVKYLDAAIHDHNNRPHNALHGLTPLEVLHGKQFDKNDYQLQVASAQANRIIRNRRANCCSHNF